jgi:hypothetical protein
VGVITKRNPLVRAKPNLLKTYWNSNSEKHSFIINALSNSYSGESSIIADYYSFMEKKKLPQ